MINQIITELSSSEEQIQQNSIYLIGYAFEKYRGVDDGCIPFDIASENIDKLQVNKLIEALQFYIANQANELNRSSAYYALGKLHDFSLRDYLIKCLNIEIDKSPNTVFQLIIALRNIGEELFVDQESLSSFEHDRNLELAKKYLEGL